MWFYILVASIILCDVSIYNNAIDVDFSSNAVLKSFIERLNFLEGEIVRISGLERENKEIGSLINERKKQLHVLSKENDRMKMEMLEQNGRIQSLERQVVDLYDVWAEMYGESFHNFNSNGNDNEQTMKRKTHKERNVVFGGKGKNSSVAFSALADTVLTVNANDKIPFGYTEMNEGNGYNATSGVFVCPSSGLYIFSYHIFSFSSMEYGGSEVAVWLKVNNLPILLTVENAPNNETSYNIHGTTIARLNDGDQVWVESGIDGTIVMMVTSNFVGVRLSD